MGAELTVADVDLLAEAPSLRLGKRAVSVHPNMGYQSYEEGLALYC